jgi:thiol-disulfide isomerase/thioredoxin
LADFTQILEGVVRRLNLVGQPMQLDGKLLSGGSLDWSKYSGKVVLVVFWAPDYLPCVQAVPSWKEIYEKYHGKGLELLGISLDRDNRTLEDFVKTQSLPWPNVVNSGKTNVNMIRYGVTNLPTTMLVGKDGKVLAVNLGGDALEQKLNSLLGPVESDAVKKSEK